ncbi:MULTISPECIES: THUMP domain-containing protein [unclassified Methanopyrus]|uniref:THUMP domain-containing protein n=1 Tax=unclassified Methanopyrus TaxID=2684913 RepID=UPI000B4A6B80|nr:MULTISPECIES: THUMP domain-containing protein [unclassified Methanopyrus]
MELLLTLVPDVRPDETERMARKIQDRLKLPAEPDPLKPVRRLRIKGVEDPDVVVNRLREKFPEVSRIVIVKHRGRSNDLDRIAALAAKLAKNEILPHHTFAVDARRLDKDLPYTSRDLAIEVGEAVRQATGASVDLDSPDRYVDVHVSRRGYLIGITPATLREPHRGWLPSGAFKHIHVCCERPETGYEIADLIRITAALKLGSLILVEPNRDAVRGAEKKVGASSLIDLRIERDLKEALAGFDVVVGLHPTAPNAERELLRAVKGADQICLLTGSETKGLSREAKELADVLVHLGPTTAEPMRTANAVAYAVGVMAARTVGLGSATAPTLHR